MYFSDARRLLGLDEVLVALNPEDLVDEVVLALVRWEPEPEDLWLCLERSRARALIAFKRVSACVVDGCEGVDAGATFEDEDADILGAALEETEPLPLRAPRFRLR
jgi:argininosuccinate synthase